MHDTMDNTHPGGLVFLLTSALFYARAPIMKHVTIRARDVPFMGRYKKRNEEIGSGKWEIGNGK